MSSLAASRIVQSERQAASKWKPQPRTLFANNNKLHLSPKENYPKLLSAPPYATDPSFIQLPDCQDEMEIALVV